MAFLRRLFKALGGGPAGREADSLPLAVRCNRCGEVIRARVNLRNDLSPDYGDGDGALTYVCRKVLMGQERCFQQIEVTLRFDANRNLIDRQVMGGEFVEQ
jgi:hypothetical protein